MHPTEAAVREVLRENVVDREQGINVVDLGLVYEVQVVDGTISVDITLTHPGSPMAGELPARVEEALRTAFGDYDVEGSLVWEPAWGPERMSDELRQHFADR